MAQVRTIDILNRLYMLHYRSLPAYLHYAPPDRIRNHPQAREVLTQIVTDQAATADRFATMILDEGGTVVPGEFPMWFTGLHDLSVEYLVKQLIERQEKFIAACEGLADQLTTAPYAQAAAREAVGEAKGHLDNLKELVTAGSVAA
ncbi:MAG: hypothetical protein MUF06_09365 [Pirellulaceae bacterium]|jgi:hypothetical protein|nr:hypothetical protein [Pirellulaceae bacterium]